MHRRQWPEFSPRIPLARIAFAPVLCAAVLVLSCEHDITEIEPGWVNLQDAQYQSGDGGVGGLCGNGFIDYSEDCDDRNLGGRTCQSEGFRGGDLRCDGSCML